VKEKKKNTNKEEGWEKGKRGRLAAAKQDKREEKIT